MSFAREPAVRRTLNLTQGGEYAIAALARLALLFPEPASVQTLARAQKIPRPFLAKILSACAKAGLVRAKSGAAGGMTQAHDPKNNTNHKNNKACEGELRRSDCVFYSEHTSDNPFCEVYCPLRRKE